MVMTVAERIAEMIVKYSISRDNSKKKVVSIECCIEGGGRYG